MFVVGHSCVYSGVMTQTQVLSLRLTLDEVAQLSKIARCPCCKQRITKPTSAAQAIIRAALAGTTETPEEDDSD